MMKVQSKNTLMKIQNSEEESYQLQKINELRAKKLKRQQEETRMEQIKA